MLRKAVMNRTSYLTPDFLRSFIQTLLTGKASEWIAADEKDGYGSFSISVEALNKEIPCAAFSKKKQKWYDRNIVFLADSLPDGAVMIELNDDGGTIADTQDAALQVIYIALAIIAVGGVLNHFVKKRYYE